MTQSTDSIIVSIRKPTESNPTQFSFGPGWSVQDYLNDFFEDWLHEYVYIVVDGEHTEDYSVVPQESLSIEFVPGDASFWIGVIISVVAGYVAYRYMKRKMGNDHQAEEIDTLRSQRNRVKKYEPVPIVLGERRVVPQLASQPFTEYQGRDQYLNLLLSVCHAPVSIKDIRLGDTSIYDLEGRDHWITVPQAGFAPQTSSAKEYIYLNSENQITRGPSFPEGAHIPLYVVEPAYGDLTEQWDITATDMRPSETTDGISIIEGFDFFQAPSGSGFYQISSGKLGMGEDGDELEIQVYDGYTNPNPITLFPNDVFEENVDFEFKYLGSSEVRTTAPNTDRIGVDYFFPQGVFRASSGGGFSGTTVHFLVEYRETGTDTWQVLRDWHETPKEKKGFFVSFNQDVPTGQYDVRTTLIFRNESSDRLNDLIWTTLKSFRGGPAVVTDASALIAVRIKATERASGTLDRLNCIVSSLVPADWNTDWSLWRENVSAPTAEDIEFSDKQGVVAANLAVWLKTLAQSVVHNSGIMKESSNPAELFRWMLQGPFISKRVGNDKIDMEGLEYFREFANLLEFECNTEIEKETILAESLNSIAATSFGEMIIKQGRFSVAIDEPKDYYSAVYNFSNSNSVSFEREFFDPIDGYRVEFDNKEMNYERDEIVVSLEDDNPTSGNLERVNLWGITGYDQAYRVARRLLAERTYRTEAWNFTANIESVDVTRGDVVLVQMPTVEVGVCAGRITSVGSGYVDVDEECPTQSGEDYAVTVVYSDNSTETYSVTSTSSNRIYISGAFSASVGDRFHFGVQETVSRECLVQEVKPNADLSFDVVLVNYAADDVFNIDSLAPPEYSPTPGIPDDQLPSVRFAYFRTSRDRYQTEGGAWKTDVDVGYKVSDNFSLVQFDVELQYRREGSKSWTKLAPQNPQEGSFSIEGVRDGEVYDFRIRAVSSGSEAGDWFQSTIKIVSRVAEDPELPRVTGLKLYGSTETEFFGRDIKLVWRKTSNSASYELGEEPAGADDGGDDPYFESYEITVIDPDTRDILRVEQVKDTFYNYTYEKNLEDGGPRRQLTFDAKIRGKNNQTGISSRITVENPVPYPPVDINVYSGVVLTTVNWSVVNEEDVVGYIIVASDTSGFNTGTAEVVYFGTANSADLSDIGTVAQGSGETFYFRIATVDSFYNNEFPEELIYSDEYTVETTKTAEFLLAELTDSITETQLDQDLRSEIALIGNNTTSIENLETITDDTATQVTQLTSVVGESGGAELLHDPSVEKFVDGSSVNGSEGWYFNTSTSGISSNYSVTGPQALRLVYSFNGPSNFRRNFAVDPNGPTDGYYTATPGTSYRVSAQYLLDGYSERPSYMPVALLIRPYDSNKNELSSLLPYPAVWGTDKSQTSWHKLYGGVRIPDDSRIAYFRIEVRFFANSGTLYVDDMSIKEVANYEQRTILEKLSQVEPGRAALTWKLDVDGRVSGFGIAADGGATDAIFRVDRFAVGAPGSTDRLPFVIDTSTNQVVIDQAVIADATITRAMIGDAQIDRAKIQDGEITNAKIEDASITTAKIGDAQVDTLRIGEDAVSAVAVLDTKAESNSTFTTPTISINHFTGAIGEPTIYAEFVVYFNSRLGFPPSRDIIETVVAAFDEFKPRLHGPGTSLGDDFGSTYFRGGVGYIWTIGTPISSNGDVYGHLDFGSLIEGDGIDIYAKVQVVKR